MGKKTVKNYPSPRLMQTIGATNQSVAEAIGELVANCFDARAGEDRLNIYVDMRSKEIAVIDDGRGMTSRILERAVCIAEDMSQYIERGAGAKGHFGMGFKTSCATLGRYYEIFTRPLGKDVEYHVAFDIAEYSRRPTDANAWDVIIEDGPKDPQSPLGNREHGSAFVIKRLNDKDANVSAVLKYLGSAFKGHIESGDRIVIIDEDHEYEAVAEKRKYVNGSKVPIDLRCGPEGALHIVGWVAIDEQIHNDALYGFNIYRRGQLVDAWNRDWFAKHLMTSRIFGEVEMDFLDATFYKQGLQQSENWKIASEAMREFLKPVVKASRALSRKGNIHIPVERKRIISEMQQEYAQSQQIDFENDEVEAPVEDDGSAHTHKRKTVSDKIKTLVREDELVLEDGTPIPIMLTETTSTDRMKVPFDYMYDDSLEDNPTLQVVIYTDHPLFKGRENQNTIRILATADAIYRVLVEKRQIDSHKAFNIKNEWIMKRLESKE